MRKIVVESLTPIESYWAFPGGRVGELCPLDRARELARARARSRAASTACWPRAPTDANTLDGDHELPSQIETDSERQAQLRLP